MQQPFSLSSKILVNNGDWLVKPSTYNLPVIDSLALAKVDVMVSFTLEVSSRCRSSIIVL